MKTYKHKHSSEWKIPSIKLKGFIDRIDKVGDHVRVLDYKTGNVEEKDLKITQWEGLFTDGKNHSISGYFYAFLYYKEHGAFPMSGISSFRNKGSWIFRSGL